MCNKKALRTCESVCLTTDCWLKTVTTDDDDDNDRER